MPDLAEVQALIDSGSFGASDGPLSGSDALPLALREGSKMGSKVEGGLDSDRIDSPEAGSKSLEQLRQEIKTAEAVAKKERANPQPEEKHSLPFDPHLESLTFRTTGKGMMEFESGQELMDALYQDKNLAPRLDFIRKHPEFAFDGKSGDAIEQFLNETGLPATVENLEYAFDSLKQIGAIEMSSARSRPVTAPVQHRPAPKQNDSPQMSDTELRKLGPAQLKALIAQEAHKKGIKSGLTQTWDEF